jgi:hypothetical protein
LAFVPESLATPPIGPQATAPHSASQAEHESRERKAEPKAKSKRMPQLEGISSRLGVQFFSKSWRISSHAQRATRTEPLPNRFFAPRERAHSR